MCACLCERSSTHVVAADVFREVLLGGRRLQRGLAWRQTSSERSCLAADVFREVLLANCKELCTHRYICIHTHIHIHTVSTQKHDIDCLYIVYMLYTHIHTMRIQHDIDYLEVYTHTCVYVCMYVTICMCNRTAPLVLLMLVHVCRTVTPHCTWRLPRVTWHRSYVYCTLSLGMARNTYTLEIT
jgi:hypothetical protein